MNAELPAADSVDRLSMLMNVTLHINCRSDEGPRYFIYSFYFVLCVHVVDLFNCMIR